MHVERVPVPVATRAPHGTTNCYVLGTDRALLVDPPAESDALDAALSDRTVAAVAVTHHHPDHVGAVGHYAREHDATVWCRRGREAAFRAAASVAPDRTFVEGTTVRADGPVQVLDTPGHAPEHVAFAVPDGVVCGDVAVAEGSVVVGAPEGDMRAYCSSLRRLWACDPDRLYPGHGPVIEDPRATCERLLDHRYDRERRVRAAIGEGARTLDEITDAAYEKDVSAVRQLAVATVRAHVEKLAVEGQVRWDGERAAPA
ncbi:MBL fold metallo-hydrolase [Halorarius halobius]|uniref:MBL fold metallo-hydrolase n=1 Tax=Halorarius halobius TaxID=2962671 RepID=UPI0020CCB7B2|nr:MBL fold metallo-hydrolase [Halorarius halobius]